MLPSQGSTRATVTLGIVTVIFAAAIVQISMAAFARREAPTFEITPFTPGERTLRRVHDTVTVDARDETRWTFFDFERRSTVLPPDTAAWDLAFRRFDLISSAGARNMGVMQFDSVLTVPNTEFVPTTWAADTVNPALDRWYNYSFTTHLLMPEGSVYVVRTPEAGSAKLQLLSYYCHGMVPGCVTFRYEYAPPGTAEFVKRRDGTS